KPVFLLTGAACASAIGAAHAQAVPKPLDKPYPGVIELRVDATNIGQKIFTVPERIPVERGPVTLLYPQWRLGAHAPADGALAQLAGLALSANRRRIEWQRDPLDMYAFHAAVPAGSFTLAMCFRIPSPH